MEHLTFKKQVYLGIVLIVIGNLLSFILHQGLFANIAWILYGLLFIFHPVYPVRYSTDTQKAKLGARLAGILCILIGVLTRFVV